ncbi:hypothetical protein [Actinomadura sp. 3N407]|uniref:hypothetical protein n=1 Tax=Actinomadura sp. 3N407 TaxID=3457423 RepID=UPI003FCED238
MQCPTCGNDTPGTLGKCSHCEAPIDVYSVGPVVPLSAPVADAPAADSADALGDRTMMVPPPTPSWASNAGPPATPDLGMPSQTAPEPPAAMPMTPSAQPPAQTQPPMSAQPPGPGQPPGSGQPPLRLSVEPSDPPVQQPAAPAQPAAPVRQSPFGLRTEAPVQPPGGPQAAMPTPVSGTPTPPGSPLPPVDPEDTAAWTFNPDEDDDEPEASSPSGGFGAPPPPAWGGGLPALPANENPAPPASGSAEGMPNTFGLEPLPEPAESIVPESWFAQPRKPEGPDAEATQMWGRQQPGAGAQQPPTMLDADATQIAPGQGMHNPGMPGGQGSPMGFGGDFDQTRMDPGQPMAAPPMAQGPMVQGPPMGGPMGGPMGQGMPMGPMGQGGPGGPGDPAYGGYPPNQGGRPGGGTSKPLIAAVAALVTVAVGSVVFVVWPSGGNSSADGDPTPAPSNKQVAQKNEIPTETKQQAAAVNKILDDSVATRRVLAGALGRAGKCKTLPQAIQGFEKVAQHRQNQLVRTKNLQVGKLANGERLRGSLAQALTASLQVDQVLLRWAQQNQANCRGKPRPAAAKVPGRAASERRATTAKQKFVVLWNPVAKKTGQPERSWKRV